MKFIELLDVDNSKRKTLINMNNIIKIHADNNRKGIGLKSAKTIIILRNDEYIRVDEDYETIKEIIERMI